MTKLFKLALLFIILSLTGCASYYRAIGPEKINYPPSVKLEKISLTYRYDVLKEAGNKKFVNNEFKHNMKVVAVKLTNNSDTTINISKDVSFYCGASRILLLNPIDIKTKIKQSSPAYAWYLVGCISIDPIDIVVFGGIGVGNIIVANEANKKLLNELVRYDISNKDLKKGESIIGIIGFEALHSDPLSVIVN
jgi:hypothetical protein